MDANTFGKLFRVTTFGESHGEALGCVIDGCPAGIDLSVEDIQKDLEKRRPGVIHGSREEKDIPEILSGVFEGKTLGSPIAIIVRNTNQNSGDYEKLKNIHRPSHADFTWEQKFGFRDYRGGGRSSGRETLCRVAAGAVAKKILAKHGIIICAWTSSIAGIQFSVPGEDDFHFCEIEKNHLRVPLKPGTAYEEILKRLELLKKEGDSAGGIISCLITGAPSGLGEPVFDKLDARLAGAMLSIGACKGIEFGSGFASAYLTGSENNSNEDKTSGGILGGISSGKDIFFNAVIKPTPSILKQETQVAGRHDVCIVPRAVSVVEAMATLTLADFLLLSKSNKI